MIHEIHKAQTLNPSPEPFVEALSTDDLPKNPKPNPGPRVPLLKEA